MREPTAGELNRRIVAHIVGHAACGASALRKDTEVLFRAWAKVEVIGGASYFESVNLEETISHRFIVRYVPQLTRPQDMSRVTEIECEGLFYRVRRVTDMNGAHRFTAIECEELGTCPRR